MDKINENYISDCIREHCYDQYLAVQESTKDDIIKKLQGPIKNMFEHMIKYVYNPQKQSTSWLGTIIDGYMILINTGLDKVYQYIDNNKLDSYYKDGRRKAESSDECNTINKSPKNRPYDWNLDLLTNIDAITNFLYMYYNYNNIYPFDIDEYINFRLKHEKPKKKRK